MINPVDLRDHVIEPALIELDKVLPGCLSPSAVNLLLGTAAHESKCGYHLVQVNGPALGVFQIEPATHSDVWDNWLAYRPEIAHRLARGGHDRLIWDLRYATIIARLVYWRAPEPLPEPDDSQGLAAYWKKHYNTEQGRGSRAAWLDDYNNVLGATV